jgi:Zn-dependent peptidase ImmA (M78 family)
MTYGQMRRYADTLSISVSSRVLPKGVNGIYSRDLQVIVIDRRLTYRQKRCTLLHELMHWNHQDESCTAHYLRKNEIRARKETAIALINPDEYRIAEVEYDGKAGCMADELEVTMSVLNDYREYILSATGSLASRWGRNG